MAGDTRPHGAARRMLTILECLNYDSLLKSQYFNVSKDRQTLLVRDVPDFSHEEIHAIRERSGLDKYNFADFVGDSDAPWMKSKYTPGGPSRRLFDVLDTIGMVGISEILENKSETLKLKTYRGLRSEMGLSKREFAKLLGVHFDTVTAWEAPGGDLTGPPAVLLRLLLENGVEETLKGLSLESMTADRNAEIIKKTGLKMTDIAVYFDVHECSPYKWVNGKTRGAASILMQIVERDGIEAL